jgi:hypothetical protein
MVPSRLDWYRMCFEKDGGSCPWTCCYVPFQLNAAWRTTQIAARTSRHAGSPSAGRQGALDGRSGIVVVYGTIRYSVSEAEGRHVSRRHEGWKRKARAARSPHETMTGVGRPSVWGYSVAGEHRCAGMQATAVVVATQTVLSRRRCRGAPVQEADMEGRCVVCVYVPRHHIARDGAWWLPYKAFQGLPRPLLGSA